MAGVGPLRPRRSLAGPGLLMLLVALFGLPIVAGLLGTLLPAFGLLTIGRPAVPGLSAWQMLFGAPGFLSSLRLTLVTGVSATLLSLVLAVGFCATLGDRLLRLRWAETFLAPLLAAPHAAVAIGLGFVLAPSGWAVRLVSPWATGWELPPDIATVGDPLGLALVAGLVVKETPFLVLVLLAALNQVPARAQLRAAAGLGYGRVSAWIGIVLPQLYPQIRLPVFIVLAFSLSVVDMALVLGPGNPAPLAVVALRWFQAPDMARYPAAAACAALLLGLVVAAIAAWSGAERVVAWAGRAWLARGRRQSLLTVGVRLAGGLAFACLGLGGAALLAVALWSVAWRWPFPAACRRNGALVPGAGRPMPWHRRSATRCCSASARHRPPWCWPLPVSNSAAMASAGPP